MNLLGRIALVSALAIVPSACKTPEVKHDGVEVVILQGHKHSKYCGHYTHEVSWYFVPGHNHGVNCGHLRESGVWLKR